MSKFKLTTLTLVLAGLCKAAGATPIYLNHENISVSLGSSMAAEPFSNRSTADSLASIIDAPSAEAIETHAQNTHVWINGGNLELDFDFGMEYNLTTLHFWNYFGEGYDVDNIDFNFFDSAHNLVGSLLNVMPALGSTALSAEDYALSFPSNVQYVNAVISGDNGQVDFNNIGFTGELSSSVPEPGSLALFGLGLAGFALSRKKKST
ncbi:PEP-CTERM sorting domain-containing protein [Thalassomonas actiniarum]|uniref:PEP-CTERM sorting domain-containing protein n=1 Tax=Thalassomonas actiniarum TaxID=485447 RepID=A0AAE9YWT8_9GAMM|nr:PEP-CTERM sorting domain-containing protein [Thalassomonas actiniarum]WDE00938.1 PEP-CTERM sorting domain-containing protein [Thalassomonas actiniarum]